VPGDHKRNGAPTTETPPQQVPPGTAPSLPHPGDCERARQVRRLATIELTRILYGPAADLRPSPAGPAVCPATCRYCSGKRAA
jgi:hypothetical protein